GAERVNVIVPCSALSAGSCSAHVTVTVLSATIYPLPVFRAFGVEHFVTPLTDGQPDREARIVFAESSPACPMLALSAESMRPPTPKAPTYPAHSAPSWPVEWRPSRGCEDRPSVLVGAACEVDRD